MLRNSLESRVRGRDKYLISMCGFGGWKGSFERIKTSDIALWIVRGTSDYDFQQFQIFQLSTKHYRFPGFFNVVLVIGALLPPFLVSFPSSAQSGPCCSYVKGFLFLSIPSTIVTSNYKGTLFST